MPDPTLTTLAVATGGAFLGKFVGPAAEAIGKAAWEQAQQLGVRATAYLAAVGREPQPVEPKLLLPLVQAASLETNEALAEKWAALLANAADPKQKVIAQLGFVSVLREITAIEAVLLQNLSDALALGRDYGAAFISTRFLREDAPELSEYEFEVAVGNLSRLNLCLLGNNQEIKLTQAVAAAPRANVIVPGFNLVSLTPYGRAFLLAMTPPTP